MAARSIALWSDQEVAQLISVVCAWKAGLTRTRWQEPLADYVAAVALKGAPISVDLARLQLRALMRAGA